MIVLICGSRGWHDAAPIRKALLDLAAVAARRGQSLEILHGAADKGADFVADQLGGELGLTVHREPADWDRMGRIAGPVRNQRMLDNYEVDAVVAFRSHGKSRGTDDTVRRAARMNIPAVVIQPGEHLSPAALFPELND